MSGGFNLYETVTETVIEALERGVVPWHKPWKTGGDGLQVNLNSGRPYRGINQFLLSLSEYESPYWVTFKGMKKLGGNLKQLPGQEGKKTGQKSTLVVFWKRIVKTEFDPETGQTETRMVPLLRYFRVFNTDQIEWEDGKMPKKVVALDEDDPEELDFKPIEAAEAIVAGMPNPPKKKRNGGTRAYYSPMEDNYQLPPKEKFDSEAAYYLTEFHELGHSTGAKKRLNRKEVAEAKIVFGSQDYSNEELTAEMTAAMLGATSGIFWEKEVENTAAYLSSWIKKLKGDSKLVVAAAARAQRAADYILNVKYEDDNDAD